MPWNCGQTVSANAVWPMSACGRLEPVSTGGAINLNRHGRATSPEFAGWVACRFDTRMDLIGHHAAWGPLGLVQGMCALVIFKPSIENMGT